MTKISKENYNYNYNEKVQYEYKEKDKRKKILMNKIIENQLTNNINELLKMKFTGKYINSEKKLNKLNSLGYNFLDIDESIHEKEIHYKLNNRFKNNIMNYKISKIIYTLNSNSIQSLEINYKNRSNKIIEIFDVNNHLSSKLKNHEINIPDSKEIQLLEVYQNNDKKIGFKIMCNNRIYIIGKNLSEKKIEIKKFKNQFLLGIEAKANHEKGITDLDFKYTDNKKVGIYLYSGLFQLRAKLKKNPQFKKEFLKIKDSMDKKNKLIAEICDFPDTMFFPIISYIISL